MTSNISWTSFCGNRSQYDLFWSYDITLNTDNPDLTDCFQKTVLTWIPCSALFLSLFYWMPYLYHLRTVHGWCSTSHLNSTKVVGGILAAILMVVFFSSTITEVFSLSNRTTDTYAADYQSPILKIIAIIVATFVSKYEFRKGVHTSGPLFIFWSLLFICELVSIRSFALRAAAQGGFDNVVPFVILCIYFALVSIQFICQLFSDIGALKNWTYGTKGNYRYKALANGHDETKSLVGNQSEGPDFWNDAKPMPNQYVSFLSRRTFMWVTRDIFRGWRKPVVFEDLYNLRPLDRCKYLMTRFYQRYLGTSDTSANINSKERRSLLWSLFWSAGTTIFYANVLQLVTLVFQVLAPQIFGLLLDYMASSDPYDWKGIVLAAALFCCNVIASVALHNFLFHAWSAGIRVRSVVNSIVYRKALRLAGAAKKTTTVGEIVNLMAVDAQKLQDSCAWSIFFLEAPATIIVCFIFMGITIGPSCLAGLLIVVLLVPINGYLLLKYVRQLQQTQMVEKDRRVVTTNEILGGMKILKLYGWEPSFQENVTNIRERELVHVRNINLINALTYISWFLMPFLVSLATYGTYITVSDDHYLSPNKAFVTMSYINIFNFLLSIFPLGVFFAGQAIVSYGRIKRFLELDEIKEGTVETATGMSGALSLENATCLWEEGGKPILEDINFKVEHGQLVAVVGHVGSGKSSLISSLLGEMIKNSGHIKVNGAIAYVPQQAWIQNTTLRNNILFGKNYNHSKYQRILEACALTTDLQILPGGDKTEIGEKGINVSGGQKQRISLARSVYQDESIYLLDDPLSAVDAHVGKHIFEKVIGPKGVLANKTRILVTHSVTFLPQVDFIVVLKDGKVSEMGGYQYLIEQNGDFAEFLRTYINEMEDDSSDEEIKDLQRRLSRIESSKAVSGTESDIDKSAVSTRRRSRHKVSLQQSQSIDNERHRKISMMNASVGEKLIDEEIAEEGSVRASVIWNYVKAGGLTYFNLTVWFHLIFTVAQVGTNLWLSAWTNVVPVNESIPFDEAQGWTAGYGGFIFFQGIVIWIVLLASALGTVSASRNLHNKLLDKILHAPMSFFDTTPLGRILNRFSRDLDVIDSNIPVFLRGWLFNIAPLFSTIIIICYSSPIFLAVLFPLAILYYLIQRAYITYVRQLKRIDNMRKSPIFAHFDESIVGASSIRAYGKQEEFIAKSDRLIDESQRAFYLVQCAQRWLGIVVEVIGSAIVFCVAVFSTLQRETLSTGLAGVAITYALQTTTQLGGIIRCGTELETYMVSVERVEDYCNVPAEAEWENDETKPPEDWPQEGKFTFHEYETRYRPGLPLVLKDFTCSIRSGEKVGIVGRTGAGKSSLALALFRIIEAAGGYISIDGIKIADLGLHDLRSKLTIIPQDPVVFTGSLRRNLDPFGKCTDSEIWNALELAHLKSFVETLSDGLGYECGEGGETLSVGQRQLLCLARAVLRKTRVLILDEATAAVDLETDTLIQNTIRTQFKECTILTVAHRLNTVMDYDRIMVMDKGTIAEFDKPSDLLKEKSTIFYSLAKEAGLV